MSLQGKDLANFFKAYPVPVLCCSIVVAGLLSFYFRSGLLDESAAKLEERSKELKKIKANIAASSQLDEQLEVLTNANAKFQTTAMRVSELAKNPQFFYNFEAKTGVTLTDVKQIVTSAPAKLPADSYFVIPFNITAEGDFKQLLTFVRNLEYGENVCRITSASLSPSLNSKLMLSFNIEVLGLR
jgi:hypothetical protein